MAVILFRDRQSAPVRRWLAGACAAAFLLSSPVHAGGASTADADLATRIAGLGELSRFDPAAARRQLRQLDGEARRAALPVRATYLYHLSQAERGVGDNRAALALADELIGAATAARDQAALARGMLSKAATLSELKQLKPAHALVSQADAIAAGLADPALRFDTAVASGEALSQQGDYPAALASLQNAASLARQGGQVIPQVVSLNALARLYDKLHEFDKGFAALDEAYALAAPASVPGHVALLKNTEYGLAIDTDQRTRAMQALLSGLQLERRIGALPLVANSLVGLADMSLKDHRYAAAAEYATDAIKAARALGSTYREALGNFNLGEARLGMGQLAEGKKQMEAALTVFEAEGDMPQLQAAWMEYADALERAGDAVAALRAYHRERDLTDALFKKQRQEAIWNLEEKYGAEKKARQIESLHQENALKSAQLDNNRLQQKVWWLLATVLSLGAIVTALLYRRVRQVNAHLKRSNIELKHRSNRDPLTSLYNRRYFQDAMAARALLPRDSRAGDELGALFLIDVDHFKHVNDAHGHAVGDMLLVAMAAHLRELLRETDMIVRWGGEEFLAWLPELKRSRLDEVAMRLLAGISAQPLRHQDTVIPVTVSIGYAPFPMPVQNADDPELGWERLLHLVDMALYMAKSHGRNRAYGLVGLMRSDPATLATLDTGLERAWRDGAVNMSVVVGQ
jgi:diguanylate cyclase (GGDEF)-like protein